jgi:hypothetical protein
MAKIMNLLVKMGLVYGSATEAPAGPGTQPHDASPAAGGSSEAAPASAPPPAEPVPEVHLDTASLQLDPADNEYPLEQVYASAGISDPPHGINVYRLIEMLEAEEFRGMDVTTRAKVVAGVLRRLPTGAVEVGDVVRDAALRDRALDAFESFLANRVVAQEREVEEKNRVLQQEIDEVTRRNTELMEANRAGAEKQRSRLAGWRQRKQAEEERLYTAIEPFVEQNPVTRSAAPAPPPPVEPTGN